MGDAQFDVYVMNGCNSWDQATCDFTPAFTQSNILLKKLNQRKELNKAFMEEVDDVPADECLGYSDCDDCLADASGVCGWCDGVITDTEGNVVCGDDGNGCCGGSSGFSQCNVAFRKTCPVICGKHLKLIVFFLLSSLEFIYEFHIIYLYLLSLCVFFRVLCVYVYSCFT